ncbi:MAG: leucyl aminopeptidase [Oscillospiraceae bacterium]|nr:leucyl aminopeptidase [Oscillospiraceae bacterium]
MVKLWNQESAQWRIELQAGGESMSFRMGGEPRQRLVSLGEQVTGELLRRAAAKAVKTVKEFGGESALVDAAPAVEVLGREGLAALVQGAELAQYQRETWKERKDKPFALYITGADVDGAQAVVGEANVLAKAVCFARDLTNRPANKLTPDMMAQCMAGAAEKAGVEAQILDENETRALGMEAFHAVGDSSANPPRLIVLRWKGGAPDQAPVALVGKGVCFDSGGYCLKPGRGMEGMTGDMAGGAAVCGAVLALAENKVPVNVTAVVPAVENRISASSYLPSYVIGSMAGKTIEVGNTDAEGRLILVDAITYAIQKEKACKVVDIATLTGAIARMLGGVAAGTMSNNDEFYAALEAAADRSGEKFWRMPSFPEYKKLIETPVADLRNTSDGAGAIAAGMFIGAFAEDVPWIHLDIAGTGWSHSGGKEYQAKGATGYGVTTLYELCKGMAL